MTETADKPIYDLFRAKKRLWSGQPMAGLSTPEFNEIRDTLAAYEARMRGPLGSGLSGTAAAATAPTAHPGGPEGQILPEVGLSDADFRWASGQLGCSVAQIRAVDEVESGGGWFIDVRAQILDLDGPDGFIDGPNLPKMLFEAHHFARRTTPKNRFNDTHPNISSASWNRSLYVGGQGEWVRLHRAIELDRTAALMSASVGRYQIMGFNHLAAGFLGVEAFWEAMKESERRHLEAFVAFIKSAKLTNALFRISNVHADCVPFASGYNGAGYEANDYHVKIARAHKKWSGT